MSEDRNQSEDTRYSQLFARYLASKEQRKNCSNNTTVSGSEILNLDAEQDVIIYNDPESKTQHCFEPSEVDYLLNEGLNFYTRSPLTIEFRDFLRHYRDSDKYTAQMNLLKPNRGEKTIGEMIWDIDEFMQSKGLDGTTREPYINFESFYNNRVLGEDILPEYIINISHDDLVREFYYNNVSYSGIYRNALYAKYIESLANNDEFGIETYGRFLATFPREVTTYGFLESQLTYFRQLPSDLQIEMAVENNNNKHLIQMIVSDAARNNDVATLDNIITRNILFPAYSAAMLAVSNDNVDILRYLDSKITGPGNWSTKYTSAEVSDAVSRGTTAKAKIIEYLIQKDPQNLFSILDRVARGGNIWIMEHIIENYPVQIYIVSMTLDAAIKNNNTVVANYLESIILTDLKKEYGNITGTVLSEIASEIVSDVWQIFRQRFFKRRNL